MAVERRGIGHVEIGYATFFSKTVGERDVYLFAGITGDLHPNHVNAEYKIEGVVPEKSQSFAQVTATHIMKSL